MVVLPRADASEQHLPKHDPADAAEGRSGPAPEPGLSASIGDKISWASACHRRLGRRATERGTTDLLQRLAIAIPGTRAATVTAGLAHCCQRCDERHGSCCGAGLEDHYDGQLLLVNMLLGVQLPSTVTDPQSCLFLGPTGCQLQAKHTICINYLCRDAVASTDPRLLAALRDKEGVEIEALLHLQNHLRGVLARS